MAAMLQKNDGGKKPKKYSVLPSSKQVKHELIECKARGCTTSYTFTYGEVEVHRTDSVLALMREKAQELVNRHPHQVDPEECYFWGETVREWRVQERTKEAKA